MTGKIFRSCFLVGLAVMILCTGLFVAVMASQYEEEVYQQLQEELAYVKHGMEESGQAYLTGLQTTQRLTWVDTDGTVLYDSVADPATMENHGDRAEIRQALEEGFWTGKAPLQHPAAKESLLCRPSVGRDGFADFLCGDHGGGADSGGSPAGAVDFGAGPHPVGDSGLPAVPADCQTHQQPGFGKPQAG
ncbi:MAG: hypothetical protein ACLR1T_15155 [Evtepia gabavorous]